MRNVRRILGLTALLALVVTALGQEAQGDAQAADRLFITTAAQGDIYEIGSSRLAMQRAESQEVKDFAQRMIDDHTKTTQQLTPIAEELGVTPPSETTAMNQLMLAHLETLEGSAFETAYLEQQVLAHEAAVSAFTIASDAVQNQALKTFVSQNLPVLQEHLQMAQELMRSAMAGGGN
jgi:putative membrane protein